MWGRVPSPLEEGLGAGPSRATTGPGKPLSRGPITTSFCMRRDRDVEGRKGRKCGEGYPLTIRLDVWRSTVSSSSGIWGGAPAENGFYAHLNFEVKKKPSGTPFSVFFSDDGAPKCRGARENTPFPLSTGLLGAEGAGQPLPRKKYSILDPK